MTIMNAILSLFAVVILAGCVGPEGQIGPTGPDGEQGLLGAEGQQGEQGEQGERGSPSTEQGSPGDSGPQGEPGPTGELGIPGVNEPGVLNLIATFDESFDMSTWSVSYPSRDVTASIELRTIENAFGPVTRLESGWLVVVDTVVVDAPIALTFNADISVDVRHDGGEVDSQSYSGLTFGLKITPEPTEYPSTVFRSAYYFGITPRGFYTVVKHEFSRTTLYQSPDQSIGRSPSHLDDLYTTVIRFTGHTSISNSGGVDSLRILTNSDTAELFVNGEKVGEFEDSEGFDGAIGLIVSGSSQQTVAFDNLSVRTVSALPLF